MDMKPIFKNRVFQAVALGAVAVGVLTLGLGYVIGKAVTIGVVGGAGYLAYKYVVEPMMQKREDSISKNDVRKFSNHFYDKDAVEKEVKAILKKSNTFKR